MATVWRCKSFNIKKLINVISWLIYATTLMNLEGMMLNILKVKMLPTTQFYFCNIFEITQLQKWRAPVAGCRGYGWGCETGLWASEQHAAVVRGTFWFSIVFVMPTSWSCCCFTGSCKILLSRKLSRKHMVSQYHFLQLLANICLS